MSEIREGKIPKWLKEFLMIVACLVALTTVLFHLVNMGVELIYQNNTMISVWTGSILACVACGICIISDNEETRSTSESIGIAVFIAAIVGLGAGFGLNFAINQMYVYLPYVSIALAGMISFVPNFFWYLRKFGPNAPWNPENRLNQRLP